MESGSSSFGTFQLHNLFQLLLFLCRYCFVENMLASGSLHQGMYNILQEWYEFIHANIHIQADLIGK